MNNENRRPQVTPYTPEAWREDDATPDDLLSFHSPVTDPTAREQCRLLDLLGRINDVLRCGECQLLRRTVTLR